MKVLLINGSHKKDGCTFTALSEVEKVLKREGIDTEIIQIGNSPVRDCTGCCWCRSNGGKCVYDDDIVNEIIEKAKTSDGFVFGSPVYYAHPSGRLLSLLDRVSYAGGSALAYKPGAVVVSARRAGTTASIDAIMKHFTINQMPVISSNYWNMVHGNTPEEVLLDKEGMQIMKILGQNMAWILKCIETAKKAGIKHPAPENKIMTNFIR